MAGARPPAPSSRRCARRSASSATLVLDNTHPTRQSRARYVQGCRAAGYRVLAYWFDTTLEAALARNDARAGDARVPELAILGTLAKREPPLPDEQFDAIYRVTIAGPDFVIESLPPGP